VIKRILLEMLFQLTYIKLVQEMLQGFEEVCLKGILNLFDKSTGIYVFSNKHVYILHLYMK